ncbi:hypothetical protein AF332_16620 [Sporosarcina globispora]|uniref:Uncharacterized protein n=1 Tax=Sporosarcina globispora TaxID=1459 RepID=A0A0M0GEB6_SPOGL|nr:hypothetical protein AF332_16620 [Sporosarcina globispora]
MLIRTGKGEIRAKESEPVLIRTGKGEIWLRESEPGADSDWKRRNLVERVRIRCSFGQEKKNFKETVRNLL